MQRDAGDLSATEQIRHAQEWAGGTGHLLHLWSAATRQALYPDIDQQITARLTESQAGGTSANTLAAPSSSGSAPRSSPGTTSP
jgi:hypothetical protein